MGGLPPCRGAHKPWEILASFPKGYEVIMEHLLQRLTPQQRARPQEPGCRAKISPLIVRGPAMGPGRAGCPGVHPRLSGALKRLLWTEEAEHPHSLLSGGAPGSLPCQRTGSSFSWAGQSETSTSVP